MTFAWQNREWKSRAEKIASLIRQSAERPSVLDLGGGFSFLKEITNPDVYISVDKEQLTPETIVADFNAGEFPDFKGFLFDFVVAQGIIEYIKEPEYFLNRIRGYGNKLIISYLERASEEQEKIGRVCFYSTEAIRKLIKESGWEIESEIKHSKFQTIFSCKINTQL